MSVRLQIYYLKNGTYIESFDQTAYYENQVLFIHPFNAEEKSLINETEFKLVLTIEHETFGKNTLTYYLKKVNKLFLAGISNKYKYFISFIILLSMIGLFSIYYQEIGIIISSFVFIFFCKIGLLPFSEIFAYSFGSLFIIISIAGILYKEGVFG